MVRRGGRGRGRSRRRAGRAGVTATASAKRHTAKPSTAKRHTAERAAAAAKSPQRRCIVTGECHDRGLLLRFVVGPDGEVVPDIEARLPGRGLWLTPRRDIVERALAKRAFARAARRPVVVAPELAERVERLLARRVVDLLGLARRAALAVGGFDRVNEAVRQGRAALLLSAMDGAAGGIRKLAGAGRDLRAASVLTSAELGAGFARERIVHAAVAGGPLCDRLWQDLSRLAGLRPAAAITQAIEPGLDPRTDPGMDRGLDPGIGPRIGFAPARPAQQNGGTEAHD